MSKASLRRELYQVKAQIDNQIALLQAEAERTNIDIWLMQNTQGDFMINPLLAAKANILVALSNLE